MEYTRAEMTDMVTLIDSRIAYLRADLGELTVDEERETRRKLVPFFTDHLNRDLFVFCAKNEENIIVATAFLMVYEKPFRPDCTSARYGVVYNVVTRDAYRGQGLATTLVQMLLDAARDMKLETVMLNATEAGRPIYKKLGFVDKETLTMNMVHTLGQ